MPTNGEGRTSTGSIEGASSSISTEAAGKLSKIFNKVCFNLKRVQEEPKTEEATPVLQRGASSLTIEDAKPQAPEPVPDADWAKFKDLLLEKSLVAMKKLLKARSLFWLCALS